MKINKTFTMRALLLGLVALGAPSVQASPVTEAAPMAKMAIKTKPSKEAGLPQPDDTAKADKTAKPKPKPKPGPRDDGDGD